jgi:hypothetical protein
MPTSPSRAGHVRLAFAGALLAATFVLRVGGSTLVELRIALIVLVALLSSLLLGSRAVATPDHRTPRRRTDRAVHWMPRSVAAGTVEEVFVTGR